MPSISEKGKSMPLGSNEVLIAYVLKTDDLKNALKTPEETLKLYPGKISLVVL